MRAKLKFFHQSYAIDTFLARKLLKESGYDYKDLDSPILYRGDTRSPDKIFLTGFHRKIEDNSFRHPYITARRESYECIATSKNLCYAVGFADCPSGGYPKPEYAWVYLIYSEKGIDISNGNLYGGQGSDLAGIVNEVTLTGVAPEQILAALQIKTTKNNIKNYYTVYEKNMYINTDPSWHLLITDFKINPKCDLQYTNPDLYELTLNEFKLNYLKGYFYIPIAPIPEETDFPYTHDMSNFQKLAFRAGFTREDVFSPWISTHHVDALQNGVAIDSIRGINQLQAYGFSKGLSSEQLSDFVQLYQVDALLFGFPKEDILSSWFDWKHIQAYTLGYSIEFLRGKSELEVYALCNGLTIQQVAGINNHDQVDGLVMGFTREDVIANWFTSSHLSAVTNGLAIDIVRGKSYIELYAITNGISAELVTDLTEKNQVDGLVCGFAKNDVLAPWFSHQHVKSANDGVPLNLLIGKNETQAYALCRNLSLDLIIDVKHIFQIDGLVAGFSLNDVLSNWFDEDKLQEHYRGTSIESIRLANENSHEILAGDIRKAKI